MANIDLGTLRATIKIENADKAKKDLKDVSTSTKDVENTTKESTSSMSSWWGRFTSNLASLRADKIITNIGDAIKSVASAILSFFKGVADGIGQGLSMIIENYGDYEQLSGSLKDTLGESYDFLEDKARHASLQLQMSSNDYLKQANKMSVGLKQSLNGDAEATAKLVDRIIRAEADVMARTGDYSGAIQNAFDGIMRGNYTMLDNLQLGIKGTKAGLQEVIDIVNEHNRAVGKASNYTIDNMADVYNAIVDYVEITGVAGQASNEALHTIQGSAEAMKAAWQDLFTEVGKQDADYQTAIDNLITSGSAYITNVADLFTRVLTNLSENMPAIGTALRDGIQTHGPKVLDAISALLDSITVFITETDWEQVWGDLKPSVDSFKASLKALIAKVDWEPIQNELGKGLKAVIDWVGEQMGEWVDGIDWGAVGMRIFIGIGQAIEDWVLDKPLFKPIFDMLGINVDEMKEAVHKVNKSYIDSLNKDKGDMDSAAKDAYSGLEPAANDSMAKAGLALENGMNTNSQKIGAFFDQVKFNAETSFDGLPQAADSKGAETNTLLGNKMSEMTNTVSGASPNMSNAANTLFSPLLPGAQTALTNTNTEIGNKTKGFSRTVEGEKGAMTNAGRAITDGMRSGIVQAFDAVKTFVRGMGSAIKSSLGDMSSLLVSAGSNMMSGFIGGIQSMAGSVVSAATAVVSNAVAGVKGLLGIASPSKLFKKFGSWTMEGFEIGINANADDVVKTMTDVSQQFTDAFKVEPTIPDFTSPITEMMNSYADFANRYRVVNGGKAAATPETNITVNNYSPKALTEVETARQFRRSARALALQNIA